MTGRVIHTEKGEHVTALVIECGGGFDIIARAGAIEGVIARYSDAGAARALARGLVQVGALPGFTGWLMARPGMAKAF